jgi:cytochrome b subunit of formate dehydrogenase
MTKPPFIRPGTGRFTVYQVAWIQGIYYVLSGLWPLFSIATFLSVTGPKSDIWLVKTVGLLLAATGLVLILAGARRQVDLPIFVLGSAIALVLMGIEVVYVFKGIISAIYLLDAVVEGVFLYGWLDRAMAFSPGRRDGKPPPATTGGVS